MLKLRHIISVFVSREIMLKLVFSKVISGENKLKLKFICKQAFHCNNKAILKLTHKLIHKLMHKLSLEFIAAEQHRGFILITVEGFHVTSQHLHKFFCKLHLKFYKY